MFTINATPIKQIGYGAMGLEGYYGKSDDKAAIEALIYAIEHNMMIDTADAYGGGRSETMIGNWLRSKGSAVRDQILLSSKETIRYIDITLEYLQI